MQTATKIPDFQPIFNILLPKCVCLRGFASDPTWGLPAPPSGKHWVSPLQRALQNWGPQGPETPRSATVHDRCCRRSCRLLRCRWRLIDRDRRTMAGRCFIQINIGAGDSVFAIVVGVFRIYKKLLGSTGKLASFWVQPGHLEKQAETFRICLGGISDYCPESPNKSGGGFFQNGGLTKFICNV